MLRLFFVTAIWLFIALNIYNMVVYAMNPGQVIGEYPAGYDFKVFLGPFFLVGFELFLWFRMFMHEREPARIFAGLMGAYILLMVIFVNLIVADLYEREISTIVVWLYAYAGIGHLSYAFFGRQRHY